MPLPEWSFQRTRSLVYGLKLPWESVRLLFRKPSLILWSLLPLAITVVLYGFLISSLQDWAQLQIRFWLETWGVRPEGWLAWSFTLLVKLVVFFAGAFTFAFAAGIAASPFNDFLAEATERWAEPPLPSVPPSPWAAQLRLIGIDIAKTFAATVATVAAILLSWVPIVNLVAFALACLLLTFQFVSYPQTRRGVGIGEGLLFLWKHAYACVGFGGVMSVLFALPLVSILALPVAVIGGTLLTARAPGLKDAAGQWRLRPLK